MLDDLTDHPDVAFHFLPQILHDLKEFSEDWLPAMVESLRLEEPHHRIIAATMLLNIKSIQPQLLSPEAFFQAETIVADAINGHDFELLARACTFLVLGAAPRRAVAKLQMLTKGDNPILVVAAAIILFQTDFDDRPEIKHQAVCVLHTALDSEQDMLVGLAAETLLRGNIQREFAEAKIKQILRGMNPQAQYRALVSLEHFVSDLESFFEVTAEILANSMEIPEIREQAACVLGRAARGTNRATPLLLEALRSPEWLVVAGAVEGLAISGDFPEMAAPILGKLLMHKEEEMRKTAAIGLRHLGVRSHSQISHLVHRLEEEHSLDVCNLIMQALSAAGDAAIPDLMSMIRGPVSLKHEMAIKALALTGDKGVNTLAELLLEIDDDRIRMAIALVLGFIRGRAAPAIPVLAKMLNEVGDELAFQIAWSLYLCGPWATQAIPALVRCIVERGSVEDDIGNWAERTLFALREQAVPALEAAMEHASVEGRQRIERSLSALIGWKQETLMPLDQLGCDDLIERFVYVGEFLKDGPISWTNLSDAIKKKYPNLKTPGSGVSPRNLAIGMRKLATELKVSKLTTHRGQRKGKLTPEGRQWWEEARKHRDKLLQQGGAAPHKVLDRM